jgi:transposase
MLHACPHYQCANVVWPDLERFAIAYMAHYQYSPGYATLPQDLRDRIITALETGTETQRAIAKRFCVSGSFVEQLWQRWRRRGSSAPQPHAGGKRGVLQDHLERLRTEVEHQPDATLEELRERLAAAQGPQVSSATSCRA